MRFWPLSEIPKDSPVPLAMSGTLLFLLLLIALRLAGALQPLELGLYDRFLVWRSGEVKKPAEVIVIELNEDAIEKWGWPIPDEVLAQLLERILSGNPSAVGVDLYRDVPVAPGSERLDSILLRDDRIYGVSKFPDTAGRGVKPRAVLASAGRYGFADMLLDADARVRRGLLYLSNAEGTDTALGLQLAARHLIQRGILPTANPSNPQELMLGDAVIPPLSSTAGPYEAADRGGYQFLLDFERNPKDFKRIAATSLLEGEVSPGLFKDEIVVIGATTFSVKDSFETPLSGGETSGQVFGVYLHVMVVDQMLRLATGESNLTEYPGRGGEILIILVASVLTAVLSLRRRRPEVVLLGTTVICALIFWGGYELFVRDYWTPVLPAILASGGSGLIVVCSLALSEAMKRRWLMRIFAAQVSPEIASSFWAQRSRLLEGHRPVPQRLTSTVMFLDLAGSTAVSERLSALDLMSWLDAFFERMTEVALAHGGLIEKFTGDGLMVVFGAPLSRNTVKEHEEDARNAAQCALDMAVALKEVNRGLEARQLPTMRIRIGLASGEVSAGTIGNRERMQYTVIGETANLAARMESYEKDDPVLGAGECRILMTDGTRSLLGAGWDLAPVGKVIIRGKSEPMQVWRLQVDSVSGYEGAR